LLTLDRSVVFLFYLLPAVPFMCLALGYVTERLSGHRIGVAIAGSFAVIAVGLFVFYFPIMTARPLAPSAWKARLPFRDCNVTDSSGRPHPLPSIGPGPSPSGWCWI
jgi:dolichyl-phosphate-mannose--protein O-mannosyl transferase